MRILYDNALLNQDVVLDMKLHESTLCDNGKIPDMSKYHNNATITGAVWTPPYGYTLDGIDDWLSIPDSANWDFINSNFTFNSPINAYWIFFYARRFAGIQDSADR